MRKFCSASADQDGSRPHNQPPATGSASAAHEALSGETTTAATQNKTAGRLDGTQTRRISAGCFTGNIPQHPQGELPTPAACTESEAKGVYFVHEVMGLAKREISPCNLVGLIPCITGQHQNLPFLGNTRIA